MYLHLLHWARANRDTHTHIVVIYWKQSPIYHKAPVNLMTVGDILCFCLFVACRVCSVFLPMWRKWITRYHVHFFMLVSHLVGEESWLTGLVSDSPAVISTGNLRKHTLSAWFSLFLSLTLSLKQILCAHTSTFRLAILIKCLKYPISESLSKAGCRISLFCLKPLYNNSISGIRKFSHS